MTTKPPTGRPVSELTDEELEHQGKQAHDTRNWVFLHGTAEQFENHTTRMLALEQEYLRRYPKRTWQGFEARRPMGDSDPVGALLTFINDAGGRVHKLELHQAARDLGLQRDVVAELYGPKGYIVTDRADRVLTDVGRDRARDVVAGS